jgi:hypothetical protein
MPLGVKLLQRCASVIEAQHRCNVLRAAGFRAEVRNVWLSGAVGDIPQLETWPQVWISETEDASRALQVLADAQTAGTRPGWVCPACGEWLEGQFGQCWKCGADRPAE